MFFVIYALVPSLRYVEVEQKDKFMDINILFYLKYGGFFGGGHFLGIVEVFNIWRVDCIYFQKVIK